MYKVSIALTALTLITALLADDDSVKIRGRLDVVDDSEETNSGAQVEDYDDKIFDELPSLRIAREYLRQKIAAERQQRSMNTVK
uniref:Secreted RxLR effector peptide protein n=1 Tax=Haemonchus contortus TaxID=6289 RepID=W6NA32_HAECO